MQHNLFLVTFAFCALSLLLLTFSLINCMDRLIDSIHRLCNSLKSVINGIFWLLLPSSAHQWHQTVNSLHFLVFLGSPMISGRPKYDSDFLSSLTLKKNSFALDSPQQIRLATFGRLPPPSLWKQIAIYVFWLTQCC